MANCHWIDLSKEEIYIYLIRIGSKATNDKTMTGGAELGEINSINYGQLINLLLKENEEYFHTTIYKFSKLKCNI